MSCEFSSLLSFLFLLIIRMECWLPSSSHAEWETGNAAYNSDLLEGGLEVVLVGKKKQRIKSPMGIEMQPPLQY